ncbi:DUF4209 domain-containing protein [Bacteroides cellulosilyticus]|uniref:DUF4209 domain-containing protein n=1 Tax=Bacteroides cellulosilyticus TaxID=246787 RepID=UPI0022E45A72|nr:DUF4209 domain-containing protein [Bacteroides cellulosilyticus]
MGKGDRKTRKGKRFINSPRKGARHEYTKSGNKNMEQKVEKKQNAYEKYIEKLDTSSYGHNDSYKINDEFQEVIRKLVDAGLNDIVIKADLDRQVFAVRKSFDYVDDEEQGIAKGLSWQASGIKTLQDGTEAPFYWPDVRNYTQEDFEYFEERYKEAKNLYAKTEYGLMVYFGEKTEFAKRNDFKSQLSSELQKLAEKYYDEARKGDYQKIGYILSTLTMAFKIASSCKLETQLEKAINLLFEIQQNWDIESTNTTYVPLRYSAFMSDNYSIFKKYIDFSKVVSRNDYAIKIIENENSYSAVDALIINDKIKRKINQPIDDSIRKRAELYEKIASQRKNDMASIHFIELALALYKQLNDEVKTQELEILYSENRGSFPLNQVSTQLPQTYTDAVNKAIEQTINTNNEKGLLDVFANSPWYETDESIRSLSETVERGLIDSLPLSIIDERGNIIKTYSPDEGKFWSTYSYYFGFGTMKMFELFKAAVKSGRLTYESTISYLENTWLNESIERNYNGTTKIVIPLDTIKPGIKRIFEEFNNAVKDEKYVCDFVTIIDSLTLKIEGVLRFFIERLGIPTFATRRTKTGSVIMEKLFDDIIADLQNTPEKPIGFEEDHRTLIKYVMSEKIGWNLRNEVAHALLQIEDYTPDKVIVLFCLILKLSKYSFTNKNDN